MRERRGRAAAWPERGWQAHVRPLAIRPRRCPGLGTGSYGARLAVRAIMELPRQISCLAAGGPAAKQDNTRLQEAWDSLMPRWRARGRAGPMNRAGRRAG